MLGFSSAECVVVEDAPTGVGSGVAAGSPVLGVLGTHKAEDLYGAGASFVVGSLEGVKVTRRGRIAAWQFVELCRHESLSHAVRR